MTADLAVDDVSFTYASWSGNANEPVLRHISCAVRQGSRTLVLGPYNGGKTTLARILCGVCPKYLPGELSGSVLVKNYPLPGTEPWELLPVCGYVSQNPQEQFIASSVEDEVAFPLESLGLERGEIVTRVNASLASWGLEHLRSASEQELSGGERKRVLLAVLEAVDPPVWILDEPFDDLDVQWRNVLSEKIATGGKTVLLFASRYLSLFDDLFDTFALLSGGSLRFGPSCDIRSSFAEVCGDDLPNPLHGQKISYTESHCLECRNVMTVRHRVSTMEDHPFSLAVPSFFLESGDLLTLVGPNGSGKSSFSRLFCGLDVPQKGTFSLDGKAVQQKALNRTVGYLFQNPDLQIFLPTVRDELAWSFKHMRRTDASTVRDRIEECAAMFGLDLDATPSTMSYPLRKALQAAVYYLLDRPFYILDELDNALTYSTALSIVARLRRNGAGILLITHDERFARMVSSDVCSIADGTLERQK